MNKSNRYRVRVNVKIRVSYLISFVFNELFNSVNDVNQSLAVNVAEITGVQPTLRINAARRCFFIVQVT